MDEGTWAGEGPEALEERVARVPSLVQGRNTQGASWMGLSRP